MQIEQKLHVLNCSVSYFTHTKNNKIIYKDCQTTLMQTGFELHEFFQAKRNRKWIMHLLHSPVATFFNFN